MNKRVVEQTLGWREVKSECLNSSRGFICSGFHKGTRIVYVYLLTWIYCNILEYNNNPTRNILVKSNSFLQIILSTNYYSLNLSINTCEWFIYLKYKKRRNIECFVNVNTYNWAFKKISQIVNNVNSLLGKQLVSKENDFTKTSQCVDNQAIRLNIILKYKLSKKNTVQSFVEFF